MPLYMLTQAEESLLFIYSIPTGTLKGKSSTVVILAPVPMISATRLTTTSYGWRLYRSATHGKPVEYSVESGYV